MKRWQAVAALAGLFALGVLSGGLGAHLYYARALDRPPGPPPFFGRGPGAHLERHLDLTPEQGERLRRILEETRHETEQLRRDMAPRMREVMERSEQRIGELLSPQQRERFEALRREHRHRSDRFFDGRGGRPGHSGHRPGDG